MSQDLKFNAFSVRKLLSRKENATKANILKVNEIYNFQIQNALEENLAEDGEDKNLELESLTGIQIEEEGDYAIIMNLNDLIKLCTYFQLDENHMFVLMLQHMHCYEITQEFIDQQQAEYSDQKLLKFIEEQTRQHVLKVLEQSQISRLEFFKDRLPQVAKSYNLISQSISASIFIPVDLMNIQEKILNKQQDSISEEEHTKYADWVKLLKWNAITPNTIFNPEFNLPKGDIWTAKRVQSFLDDKIHLEKWNHKEIDFNVSENSDPDFIEQKDIQRQKIYVEMRLKSNGKYRLATRTQSLEQIKFLFNKTVYSYQREYTKKILPQIKEQVGNPRNNFALIYLDMKDFSLNIDYDLVEKQFNQTELANYLRKREIWYNDPLSKKEQLLTLKKGIIIGEPFHDYITYKMSCQLKMIFYRIVNGIKTQDKKLELTQYHHLDDFLLSLKFPTASFESIKESINIFLQKAKKGMSEIGMMLNYQKIQVFIQKDGQQHAWSVADDSLELVEKQNFTLFNLDIMNDTYTQTLPKSIRDHIFKLVLKDKESLKNMSLLQKGITQTLIPIYLNNTNFLNQNIKYQLNQILSHISKDLGFDGNKDNYDVISLAETFLIEQNNDEQLLFQDFNL